MTDGRSPDSFGPYVFKLAPAEAEAAAARFGLRAALRNGLTASHLAPLAMFTLTMLFAAILALTGFISRRLGEFTLILAAVAFMVQRLAIRWRIRMARQGVAPAIARLLAEGASTTTIDANGVTVKGEERALRLDFADCDEVEDAGGLIYLWPRQGAPVVLPTRALAADEPARLVARLKARIESARR
jgi:hypothetical protein